MIIIGSMKTTPITEMGKTADLESLEARREYKALAQAEKAKRLPSQPLHTKLKSLTKNRMKHQTQSLNHIVKSLQKEKAEVLEPGVEMLQPDSWSQKCQTPTIRLEVPGLGKKESSPQPCKKQRHRK